MFDTLNDKFEKIVRSIKGKAIISESDLEITLREIRIALLEADVALVVVKQFISSVKESILGKEVLKSVKPDQMVIKLVQDELIKILGSEEQSININSSGLTKILFCGLQGSGKTTTVAKLASHLSKNSKKKILLSSADIYRPAAQEQLKILADQINIVFFEHNLSEIKNIVQQTISYAEQNLFDIILLDTAGRQVVDLDLMKELKDIESFFKPQETLLVADSLTGQDAANVAKNFSDAVKISGSVLTRVDGDSRGGAALSIKTITNTPIKFIGVGEKIEDIEIFHPDRIASRILGMGDVVSLVEKASEQIDQEDAEKLQKKILKGKFSLTDYSKQLDQISKMGGVQSLLKYLPGMSHLKEKVEESLENSNIFKKQKAIIGSMTKKEKVFPDIIKASRKIRISKGSGTSVQDINKLLKQFKKMSQMMKKVGKNRELESLMKSGQAGDISSILNKNKPF